MRVVIKSGVVRDLPARKKSSKSECFFANHRPTPIIPERYIKIIA
jgi:hypothetical protein